MSLKSDAIFWATLLGSLYPLEESSQVLICQRVKSLSASSTALKFCFNLRSQSQLLSKNKFYIIGC